AEKKAASSCRTPYSLLECAFLKAFSGAGSGTRVRLGLPKHVGTSVENPLNHKGPFQDTQLLFKFCVWWAKNAEPLFRHQIGGEPMESFLRLD
ncbi:MAG TPA: hypothetical protein PKE55_04430, partial [Kiritimatiellia bacterium]|nr:hypothetical protein [Kiritimatiellia bacterium]